MNEIFQAKDITAGGDVLVGYRVAKVIVHGQEILLRHPADVAYYRFNLVLDKFLKLNKGLVETSRRTMWSAISLGLAVIIGLLVANLFPTAIKVFWVVLVVGLCIVLSLIIISESIENLRIRRKIFKEFDSFEDYVTVEAPEMGKLVLSIADLRNQIYPLPLIRVQEYYKRIESFVDKLKGEAQKEWEEVKRSQDRG